VRSNVFVECPCRDKTYTHREVCLTSPDCPPCRHKRFSMTLDYIGDFSWLDELVRQVNSFAQDQFVLLPYTRGRVEDARHGSCIRCAYLMQLNTKPGHQPRIPLELARPLTSLIRNCADEAGAELVPTLTRGRPDFADWFMRVDGFGELRIHFVDPT
jgi:hypothetical protein